jgi:hypothetical protein
MVVIEALGGVIIACWEDTSPYEYLNNQPRTVKPIRGVTSPDVRLTDKGFGVV